MPLYEYQCTKCQHRFEMIQKFSDPLRTKCPKCGGRLEKLPSAPAVHFKGTGWYVTDYGKGKSPAGSDRSSGKGSSGDAESASSSEEKADKASDSRKDRKADKSQEKKPDGGGAGSGTTDKGGKGTKSGP